MTEELDRRKFLSMALVSTLAFALTGCAGFNDQMTLDEILAWLRGDSSSESDEDSDTEILGPVKLSITYPAGRSPKVFTSGWVFGARCTAGSDDISDTVSWSGTGTFNPDTGPVSRPVFSSEGQNTIKLSVKAGAKTYEKTVIVDAVSPGGYAAVGSKAFVPADVHGCPACPHPCVGPITTGSPNVFVNGKSAARVGDKGVHAACCGANEYEIISGDPEVTINGRAAASIKHSTTRHCGGTGRIIENG